MMEVAATDYSIELCASQMRLGSGLWQAGEDGLTPHVTHTRLHARTHARTHDARTTHAHVKLLN